MPTEATFRLDHAPMPKPGPGEVLRRTIYLSLDPYMRGRMYDGPSYAAPAQIGAPLMGGTISRVLASNDPRFTEGELVLGQDGWREYACSSGDQLALIDERFIKPSYALGVLGMPGLTAWVGLGDIGAPKPGETVAVAAATGAVGAVVGQLAKQKGARAIGIAGGPDKCAFAVRELGFDACVNHRAPDFAKQLRDVCPSGVDVYFENVGGKVFDAIWPLLNNHARIPVCGNISRYNHARTLPPGPDRMEYLIGGLLLKRVRLEGFQVSDHAHRREAFLSEMIPWVRDGQVKTREDIVEGLEAAPRALIGMLEGKNFGKLLVQVAPL